MLSELQVITKSNHGATWHHIQIVRYIEFNKFYNEWKSSDPFATFVSRPMFQI
jgi:hypothetical protein